MSLNMYLGEVRTQTQSMNAFCATTIQGMEQAINTIDAFIGDVVLQGQTYDSAKIFFAQTFRPLAQGIIYLCEELIRQNKAFPNDFQSQVATTDVIEQEILEQIRGIEQTKAGIEVISSTLPGMQVMVKIFDVMKRKLQEKLEHLYEFNYTSSSNYDTALQLAASIAQGLAEVQSGKGFNAASGTFHIEKLNMEWAKPIQVITEEKIRKADNKIGTAVDSEHNVYNNIEGINIENVSSNKEFTEEEIRAIQKYFEGIEDGTIKGNMDEDFHVGTDAYEMENNIFGQPVGGGKPTLDPFLVNAAKFGFDFIFGDLFTIFDQEATLDEKIIAIGMMTPVGKGVKVVDKLHDLKKVGDVKKVPSGSVGGTKGTGDIGKRASGANKIKFSDNVENHLVNSEGFSRKGVNGGHNMDSFYGELRNQGFDPNECIVEKTSHPTIEGVYVVKYQVPKKDMKGNIAIPKEYRTVQQPKTIYDPSTVSNEQMIEWGKEALNNGVVDGRTISGTASNGLKFVGYLDENGIVTNFYPVLK